MFDSFSIYHSVHTKSAAGSSIGNTPKSTKAALYNNRMQPDFGELALASAADARRYEAVKF